MFAKQVWRVGHRHVSGKKRKTHKKMVNIETSSRLKCHNSMLLLKFLPCYRWAKTDWYAYFKCHNGKQAEKTQSWVLISVWIRAAWIFETFKCTSCFFIFQSRITLQLRADLLKSDITYTALQAVVQFSGRGEDCCSNCQKPFAQYTCRGFRSS